MTLTKERPPYIYIFYPSPSAQVSLMRMHHIGDRAILKSHHSPVISRAPQSEQIGRRFILMNNINFCGRNLTSMRWEEMQRGPAQWRLYWIGKLLASTCALKANSIPLLAEVMELTVRALFRTKKRPEHIILTTMSYLSALVTR